VDLGPGVGIRLLIGRPYIFRDSQADEAGPGIRLRAPHYGEHNHEVLAGPARYGPDEIEALYAAGVVGVVPTKQPIAKALDLEALIDKGSFRGVDPDFRERLEARGLPVPATLAPGRVMTPGTGVTTDDPAKRRRGGPRPPRSPGPSREDHRGTRP
jgi:hypothetical protein